MAGCCCLAVYMCASRPPVQGAGASSSSAPGRMQVADAAERERLWLELIELEVDTAAAAGRPVAASGSTRGGTGAGTSGDVATGDLDGLDRCIRDWVAHGALALEDALGRLPEQRTLHGYQRVLLKHMEATSARARCPLSSPLASRPGVLIARLLNNHHNNHNKQGTPCCSMPLLSMLPHTFANVLSTDAPSSALPRPPGKPLMLFCVSLPRHTGVTPRPCQRRCTTL
jgi:hypothetical protein